MATRTTMTPAGGVTGSPFLSLPGGVKPPTPGDATRVVLFTEDGELAVQLRLGDPPRITGGPVVETVDRQGRRPMTVVRGGAPIQMELGNMLLDGYRARTSVEAAIRTIEKLADALVRDEVQPEKLIVAGAAVPHDFYKAPQNRWVIAEEPDWGDPVIRLPDGKRCRQGVSLRLLLWVEPDQLERIDTAAPKPNYRIYIAKQGDTFNSVAAGQLHNAKLGGELARLNRLHNPAFRGMHPKATTKINPGVQVRLPSKHVQAEWEHERRNRPRR